MALSQPRSIFGIHQITPYNKVTKEIYGTMRVLGGSTLSLSPELIDLNGGSSRYPWDSEVGLMTSELTITAREYPDWAFELFLGKKPTSSVAASTVATISTAVNGMGSSIINATNGISAVQFIPVSGEPDAKYGDYIIKATSATEVDIYISTSLSFDRGQDIDYIDDSLKITAAPITIAIGANPLPQFGIELTGIGAPAFVVGDTATFSIATPYNSKMNVVIGNNADIFPKFGCYIYSQKKGSGGMFKIDAFNVQAGGLPIGFTEKEWSEAEITAKLLYDSARGGVFSIEAID